MLRPGPAATLLPAAADQGNRSQAVAAYKRTHALWAVKLMGGKAEQIGLYPLQRELAHGLYRVGVE